MAVIPKTATALTAIYVSLALRSPYMKAMKKKKATTEIVTNSPVLTGNKIFINPRSGKIR